MSHIPHQPDMGPQGRGEWAGIHRYIQAEGVPIVKGNNGKGGGGNGNGGGSGPGPGPGPGPGAVAAGAHVHENPLIGHADPLIREAIKEVVESDESPKEYLERRLNDEYQIDLVADYSEISHQGVLAVAAFLIGKIDQDQDSTFEEKQQALIDELTKAISQIPPRPYEM